MTEAPARLAERTNGAVAEAPAPAPADLEDELASPPLLRAPAPAEPVVERRRPAKPPKPAKAPVVVAEPPIERLSRHQRKKAAKLRARKVKRIVRRLDAWSVLKVSFLFFLCLYVVSMVAVLVLWSLAANAGVIDNVESFIEDLGAFETFEFDPDKLFQGTALGGAVLAVLATGLTALAAVLFNLISDLVGGIRLTVIEEPGSKPLVRPKKSGRPASDSDTVDEPSGVTSGL